MPSSFVTSKQYKAGPDLTPMNNSSKSNVFPEENSKRRRITAGVLDDDEFLSISMISVINIS